MATTPEIQNVTQPAVFADAVASREQMNIVVVGHVDHGKSTVVGRLMADTGSLPQGKLEHVKAMCARNARPFEYAFLLDALKDEQAQGITIDTARCFFKTAKRDYIIIDAPGHVEFLKNMISGAARAEAALLVIDAHEGIQENSRRHGYMLSMLGIRQVVVLVNKMDLVGYDMDAFARVRAEYSAFLSEIKIKPIDFVPICARDGENIVSRAAWAGDSKTVLEHIDAFTKEADREHQPFRFPVQDIYKFTANNDDRRIVAGTIETGSISVGEEVIFLPSRKRSRIASIEWFNVPARTTVSAGNAVGFTLTDELYIRPGEIMCRASGEDTCQVSSRFRANVFWMGKAPMVKGNKYKLKLATGRAPVRLVEITNVLDASNLTSNRKQQVDRHEVAECIFETTKPVAFDLSTEIQATGRFVLVDNFDIAGGGIIVEAVADQQSTLRDHIRNREMRWERSDIGAAQREARFGHKAKFIVVTGAEESSREVASALEQTLFQQNCNAYYLRMSNIDEGLDTDLRASFDEREERMRRVGELARILTDSGQIFITSIADMDVYDVEMLKALNHPHEFVLVSVGTDPGDSFRPDVHVQGNNVAAAVDAVCALLRRTDIIADYSI